MPESIERLFRLKDSSRPSEVAVALGSPLNLGAPLARAWLRPALLYRVHDVRWAIAEDLCSRSRISAIRPGDGRCSPER